MRPLDDSEEAAHTAAVVSELSDAMRGILEVGRPTQHPVTPGHGRPAYFGRTCLEQEGQLLSVRGRAIC